MAKKKRILILVDEEDLSRIDLARRASHFNSRSNFIARSAIIESEKILKELEVATNI